MHGPYKEIVFGFGEKCSPYSVRRLYVKQNLGTLSVFFQLKTRGNSALSPNIFNDGGEVGLPNAIFDPAAVKHTANHVVNR